MAASGIAEHNEARRREVVYLRKAFLQREQKKAMADPVLSSGEKPMSTYDQQIYSQSRQGEMPAHDAASVGRQRRLDHYHSLQQDYSAKIQGRYTSFDYVSQW